MVAATRILPKSESVQTPVWARIGLAPPREAAKKRDRARYRFNFGLLRIWIERITQRTYTPEPWTELNSRKQPSGCITGNPHLTRRWPFGRVTEGLPTIRKLGCKSAYRKKRFRSRRSVEQYRR